MARAKGTESSAPVCASCGQELDAKALPVNHDGAVYCPACFVHVIAPESKGRFVGLLAARCSACGTSAVVARGARCPNCRWRILEVSL